MLTASPGAVLEPVPSFAWSERAQRMIALLIMARDDGIPHTAEASDDDRGLLARLRAGDGAAYEQWVRSQSGRMLAVARRLLGNGEDARDAVQDAFVSAFRAIASFEGNARLSTWLHRITVNAALMKLRSKKGRPEESIEDLLPRFDDTGHHVHTPTMWGEEADVAVSRNETARLVRAAIDRLPETYRTVLLLRDIEELDTDESARLLGVTPNAVKIRLHRARQALRALLDREIGGERA